MALTVVQFLATIGSAGLAAALILETEEDMETVHSVFWANLTISVLMAGVIIFWADAFATMLGRWRDDGVRETRFLIGAADGFDDRARAEADQLIAFGRATWPHLLARAMLAEQLYRATSILANHPYHRDG